MILTNCAACAAPLAHDAPRCVRCKIRYCDSTCQHDHGPDHELTLCLRRSLGSSLIMNSRVKTGMSYLIEAETILEDVHRRFRRVFGESHPDTKHTEEKLVFARHFKASVEEFESREES